MPTFNDKAQAVELVDAVFYPGPKPPNKADREGKIYGEQTRSKYISALTVAAKWAKQEHRLRLKQLNADQVQQYLNERSTQVSSKQLNQDFLALCLIPGIERSGIEKPRSLIGAGEKATEPRAHTHDAARMVVETLPPNHRLSGELAAQYGLRAAELYTIRRYEDLDRKNKDDRVILDKMDRRQWDEDRFHGQDGVRYVVIGKGGLPRVRVFSHEHSRQLEALRLDKPREVADRTPRTPIIQYYDITGGKRFSQAWTTASRRALDDSLGAHALRHGYAQDRMAHHLERGLDLRPRLISLVSQELGHFDPDATKEYLRSLAA